MRTGTIQVSVLTILATNAPVLNSAIANGRDLQVRGLYRDQKPSGDSLFVYMLVRIRIRTGDMPSEELKHIE